MSINSYSVDPFQNYQFILLQSISDNIESISKNGKYT